MNINQSKSRTSNRPGFRAKGFSLLPLALRPGLLSGVILACLLSSFVGLGIGTNDVYAASLTLTIPSSPVTLNLSPSASGAFSKSTASTIGVNSDAPFGYTLTIKGKGSDNSLVSSSGASSGSKIPSITSAISEATFKSGTTYQASANYPLVASGNTVTLYAIWQQNPYQYNITYNLQSGTGGPTTNPQKGNTNNSTITLAGAPTKTNYSFQGWCNKTPTNNNGTNPTCSGIKYNASATYTLSTTPASNTFTLYAMWKQSLPSLTSFQCSSLSDGQTANTTDGIPVRKVGSQCWMWTDYKTDRTGEQAESDCPTGWHLPSQSEFQTLMNNFGTGSQLYNAGWSGFYWSSTSQSSSNA